MRNSTYLALRIALIIAAFGILWVFISNDFLGDFAEDIITLTEYHTYVEWCYVAVAALLSYFMTRQTLERQAKTEDELRESEGRLRLFIEHAPAALAMFDRQMRYLAVSRRWLDDYGLSSREIIGRSHYEIFPEIPDRWKSLHRQGMEGEVLRSESDRFERMDGTIQWLRWEIRPWYARDASVGGIAIFTEDISERKAVQEALAASEEKYRLLFENSRDALLLTIPPSMQFVSVNRAALEMFGARREEELLSLRLADIFPAFQPDGMPSGEKAQRMLETALREGAHLFEWTHRRFDGTSFPAEVLLARVEIQGNVVVQGSIRDITERKLLERELKERQRIMEALQKSQIASQTASAIAHELRQPLLAISSYGEAALLSFKSGQPNLERIRRAVEGSAKQAIRAGQSIQEMLELLSLGEFVVEDIDINAEIAKAVADVRSASAVQFRADFELEAGIPQVKANHVHVQKVLHNLLNNGLEAMVGMALPDIAVRIESCCESGFAHLKIGDRGPGFGEESIKHLFEPFHTTKSRGMGMGLAISRSLIETNGGRLWLDPNEGPGATFHLTLPLAS